ncbi:elongator complex protein 5 [Lissotriton helveticus]
MVLQELLQEGTGVLIILDGSECSGRSLLKSCAVVAVERGDSVHVLGFDSSEEDFRAGFAPGISSRLTFHDGFHDPLDWNGKADLIAESFSSKQVLARVLGSASAGGPVSVIVDSLSWVLLHSPATLVVQALHQLQRSAGSAGSKLRQVIALVHQDLHEPGTVASACHVASTVVTVMPCPSSTSPACESEALATATVRHRKKTGKVIKKDLSFAVLEGFTLKTEHSSTPKSAVAVDSDSRVDPAANLTFNLNLSDSERQAKENLSLPYIFSAEKKSSLLQSRGSGGKIYYEPEAVDDVDDEDPDDDLDV